jgi:predicted RNase H-like HicB family nuclease
LLQYDGCSKAPGKNSLAYRVRTIYSPSPISSPYQSLFIAARSSRSVSAKSKNSAKAAENVRRPFAQAVLSEARKLADQYQVVLNCEGGHWYGRGLELSRVYGDGRSADAAVTDTRQALTVAVATLIEQGQRPPRPGRQAAGSRPRNFALTRRFQRS